MECACDVCVVGAGYAGLNAVNSASKYLSPGDRIAVVARTGAWGGHWPTQYSFCTLHQPFPGYSIGEHEWDLLRAKDPAQHLATRMEILSHFEDCVRRIKAESGVEIIELFGYEYRGHDEGEDAVQLTASPLMSNGAEAVRVVAGRLIKASGFDLKLKRPFVFGGGVQSRFHSLVPTVRAHKLSPSLRSFAASRVSWRMACHTERRLTPPQGRLPNTTSCT